jgi:hypothetical protein
VVVEEEEVHTVVVVEPVDFDLDLPQSVLVRIR